MLTILAVDHGAAITWSRQREDESFTRVELMELMAEEGLVIDEIFVFGGEIIDRFETDSLTNHWNKEKS